MADVASWRISRPNYDKPRRCPGWSGGALGRAKTVRCDNGFIPYGRDHDDSESAAYRWWKWRFRRCTTCGLTVWPWKLTRLSPWVATSKIRRAWDDWRYTRRLRKD